MAEAAARENGSVAPVCSAKGCSAAAVWTVVWNNPRIHTAERRKTWMACDDHRSYLATFLERRGFLRDVVAAEQADT